MCMTTNKFEDGYAGEIKNEIEARTSVHGSPSATPKTCNHKPRRMEKTIMVNVHVPEQIQSEKQAKALMKMSTRVAKNAIV